VDASRASIRYDHRLCSQAIGGADSLAAVASSGMVFHKETKLWALFSLLSLSYCYWVASVVDSAAMVTGMVTAA
jgi:hypothetical protein